MKSFNNDEQLKQSLLAEIIKHREQDKIVQGTYGDGKNGAWKGCAVGCAIHSLNLLHDKKHSTGDHSVYETEFGIPRILARLEDRIFEGLTVEESKTFPERFIAAVPVGADLEMVWPKFIVWLLADSTDGVIKYAKTDAQRKAIQDVADLYTRKINGEKVDVNEWLSARKAAYAYAYAYAADAAAAAAADAAADAAYAYADADAAAADAAYAYAAYADAAAADAAYAYADAAAARFKSYTRMADKLISILKETK